MGLQHQNNRRPLPCFSMDGFEDITQTNFDTSPEAGLPDANQTGSTSTSAPPKHRFSPGDTLAGRYRIVAFLGRGGMGEVYRADDLELAQSVAVKILPTRIAADPTLAERVREEVRLARRISHRNVCRIHDIARIESADASTPADLIVTMEYIDGEDLSALLRRIGRLPQDKAVEVARQLCAALAAAHEQGVLHRDLKPANIMLDGRGNVRLTDFGIAAIADSISAEEAASGTPAYMAPEQFEGKAVSIQSDLYALGLVLYEILTGRQGWKADTLADLRTLRATTPTPPSLTSTRSADIDPALAALIDRCLDPNPAERPRSALAVAAALPGADPLAAALAAGETPSPELVAASGGSGGLSVRTASIMLAFCAAFLVVGVALSGRATILGFAAPDEPTPVMRRAAADMLERLGHTVPTGSTAEGWWLNNATIERLAASGLPDRWTAAAEADLAPIDYWFRAAPARFQTESPAGAITQTQPPITQPGEVAIRIDQNERLRSLRVRPDAYRVTQDETGNAAGTTDDPDWAAAFDAAGLDVTGFTEMPGVAFNAGMDATQRRAWRGNLDTARIPQFVDVFIGAHGDRIVEFTMQQSQFERFGPVGVGPADPPPETQQLSVDQRIEAIGRVAFIAVFAAITVIPLVAATYNIRRRRADIRRALVVGITLTVLLGLATVVGAGQYPAYVNAILGPFPIYTGGIGIGIFATLCYIALEPMLRIHWPNALIGWTRLFSGRFRDPMVGRDLLIGLLVASSVLAILFGLKAGLTFFGDQAIDRPSLSSMQLLSGPRGVLSGSLAAISTGFFNAASITIIIIVILVAFRFVRIRVRWPALIVATLLVLLVNVASVQTAPSDRIAILVANLLVLFVLDRFGLLAAAAAISFGQLLTVATPGTDFSAWFVPNALIPAAIVVATAAFAFTTSTAPARRQQPASR